MSRVWFMVSRVWLIGGTALAVLLCLLVTPRTADAHLMPAWQGSTHLVGNRAYTLLSIPIVALKGWDDDANGRLSRTELGAHDAEIQHQLDGKVRLLSEGVEGRTLYETLAFEHASEVGDSGVTSITLMRISEWNAPVTRVTVTADVIPAGSKDQIMFRAIRGDTANGGVNQEVEVADFASSRVTHDFFRGPWRTLAEFIGVGAEHILGGPDHLLFLLAVLVVGFGWRYWLSIVTSFTVAHSVTLVASALGWVRVSPRIVEPAIAASIVLVAVDYLRRGDRGGALWQRVALVFSCGLLHGLGFAGALADLGANGSNRWASLAGFNLGVEAGQAVFVILFVATIAVLRRMWKDGAVHVPRITAVAAAGLGLALFVQRVV